MSILTDLEAIVGRRGVSTSDPVCLSYAYNAILGKEVAIRPDIVVMPQMTEEVSAIIKAVNRHKMPVTPTGMVGAKSHGGPLKGGILLDLTLMDEILPVDPLNIITIRAFSGGTRVSMMPRGR